MRPSCRRTAFTWSSKRRGRGARRARPHRRRSTAATAAVSTTTCRPAKLHRSSPEYARSLASPPMPELRLPLDGRPAAPRARAASERPGLRALGGVRLAGRAGPGGAPARARGLLRDPRGSRLRRRRRRSDGRRSRRGLRVRSGARHGARRDPHAAREGRATRGAPRRRPGARAGRRARGRDGGRAGCRRRRRLHPARRGDAARRPRLPHEPRRHRGGRAGATGRGDADLRPPALARGDARSCTCCRCSRPSTSDLVVAYPPLLPVALAQLLAERGIEIVPVPDEEFESMGTNVLALAPARRARARRQPGDARQARRRRCGGARLRRAGALAQGRRRPRRA